MKSLERISAFGWALVCVVAVWVMCGSLSAGEDVEPMPAMVAARIKRPPVIDGKLDDAIWREAQGVPGEFCIHRETDLAAEQTDVFAAFDDRALYVAFKCHEPHPEWIKADETEHDGRNWQDDCVELFLVPDITTSDFYHFILNTLGAKYDECRSAKATRLPIEWNPTWEAKAHLGKDFWSAEMRIPFRELAVKTPIRGEIWKVRFAREDYTGLKNDTGTRLSNWPVSPGGFASPTGYAQLVFESRNILYNSSFEEPLTSKGMPPRWSHDEPTEKGDRVVWETGDAPDGQYYMRVVKENPAKTGRPQLNQSGPILPNRHYRMSGWARAEGPGAVVCKVLPDPEIEGKRPRWLQGPIESKEWSRFSFEFTTQPWETQFLIQVRMAYREGTVGSICVDDLVLEQLVYDVAPGLLAIRRAEPEQGLHELAMRFGQKPYDDIRRRDGSYPSERTVFRDTAFGSEVWRMTDFGGRHSYPLVTPWNMNGSRMRFVDWRPHDVEGKCMLWVMNARGGDICLGAPTTYYTSTPYWGLKNPDTIYYVDTREAGLWATDVKTLKTRLVHQFKKSDLPRFQGLTADGERLVVGFADVNQVPGWSQGWTVRLDGSDFRPYKFRVGSEFPSGYSAELIRAIQEEGYPFEMISHGHSALSPNRKWVALPSGGTWCLREFGKDALRMVVPMEGSDHCTWRNSNDWFVASADYRGGSNQVSKVFVDGSRVVHPVSAPNTLVMFNYSNEAHPVTSPDGTKVVYASSMMGHQDMYIGVISRPLPPTNLRAAAGTAGISLSWNAPVLGKEIQGYWIYRSDESGGPYRQLNREVVTGRSYLDKTAGNAPHAYVVTAMEHSGLESVPSNEAISGLWEKPVRIYLEAEFGKAQMPMHIGRDAWGASNWHDMFICAEEGTGTASYSVSTPKAGKYRVWLRAKHNPRVKIANFGVSVDGREVGIGVCKSPEWGWWLVVADGRPGEVLLSEGEHKLTVLATGEGNAVDKILLTNDDDFKPAGFGNLDETPPAQVKGLRVVHAKPYQALLSWEINPDPEVAHYNVYRSQEADFAVGQKWLVRSPYKTLFLDWGLRPGKTYYRITAVDRMGNEGAASEAAVVDLGRIRTHTVTIEAERCKFQAPLKIREDKAASRGECVGLPADAKPGGELIAEFDAPAGTYFLWVRMAHLRMGGGRFYVSIDGDKVRFIPKLLWSLHGGTNVRRYRCYFEWQFITSASTPRSAVHPFHLKGGRHRLLIQEAQPGTVIDQIVLTSDVTRLPADISGQGWR